MKIDDIGSRKDILLRLPKEDPAQALGGDPSSSPERSSCLDPGWRPFIGSRTDTLHRSPNELLPRPRTETLNLQPARAYRVGVSDSSRIGLREIHLARAIIDYQVVSNSKGAR